MILFFDLIAALGMIVTACIYVKEYGHELHRILEKTRRQLPGYSRFATQAEVNRYYQETYMRPFNYNGRTDRYWYEHEKIRSEKSRLRKQ